MPEKSQWPDRTLNMPPQDPWAEAPTVPDGQPVPQANPFSRGRASVQPKTAQFPAGHEPTGTGWPGAEVPRPRGEFSWSQLRRGGEWTSAAVLFTFVCWGIWVISTDGDDLSGPIVVLIASLAVAAGLFALCRVVGRLVWEKQLGRVRRGAKGSHLVTALFLAGVGVAHLRQVEWVMTAWNWVAGLF